MKNGKGIFNKSTDTICLVNNIGQRIETWAYFPIGTAIISGVLKKAGYRVKVLDIDLHPELEPEISNYKVVMLGMMVGKPLSFTLRKIEELKSKKDKIVIVGGPLVMAMPNEILNETKADYLVHGDVERSLIELLEYLEGKGTLDKIAGLGYRSKSEIKINPPAIIRDLDSFPFPDLESFDTETYIKNIKNIDLPGMRSINWYTSRGCDFDCQFCSHLRNWRGNTPQRMVDDLRYLKEKYKIEAVWFYDDNFMQNAKRINEFCDVMTKERLDVKWGCEARVTSVKDDIVRKMKEAGCVGIRNGLESGSDRILKIMHKGATVQDAKNAIEVLTKFDMPVKGAFIFGSPGETIEDAKETLDFIKWTYKVNPKANLWTAFFVPRPATPWYDLAIQKGMKEIKLHEWADVYKHRRLFEFNMSDLSERQIKSIMRKVRIYKFLAGSRRKKYVNVPGALVNYLIRRVNSFARSLAGNNQVRTLEGH